MIVGFSETFSFFKRKKERGFFFFIIIDFYFEMSAYCKRTILKFTKMTNFQEK